MTEILLVRHGETEWNAAERIQGCSNSDLSIRGRKQAVAVALRLQRETLTAVYSSDLTRAVETAEPLAARHGLATQVLEDLREKSYGSWEGLTSPEIADLYPELWHQFHTLRDIATPIPGGESWPEVQVRVTRALAHILTEHPDDDDRVVIVGHGGSLRIPILQALDAPLTSLARLKLDNCGLTIANFDSRGSQVLLMNDRSHLQGI